ncbi:hypothetical protein Tco_0688295 [Tanacetum coccineum]
MLPVMALKIWDRYRSITDDKDEEPTEDEEEEEHIAPAPTPGVPVVDLVPSAGDTEVFETDESAPTPGSSQTRVPFSQTRLCLSSNLGMACKNALGSDAVMYDMGNSQAEVDDKYCLNGEIKKL